MNNLSSKQYVINQEPTNPGDIDALNFSHNFGASCSLQPIGTLQIDYWKVGKLYYGFFVNQPPGFASSAVGSDTEVHAQETADAIAAILGLTINTYYIAESYSGYMLSYSPGSPGCWQQVTSSNANRFLVMGFLAN